MVDVSVLVPVYNVKPYLRQCLDSLKAQTLGSIEFVCIDDGSTDGSGEILDAYAAGDARFRVIHKANSGYGASMNVGLRAAQGKYIGIVESDDFADEGMFEALWKVAEQLQADIVRSNYWQTTRYGSRFQEELAGFPYDEPFCPMSYNPQLILRNPNIWSAIYRKSFLEENGIWFHETPGASFQDLSFSFETLVSVQRFVAIKDAYLHYRMDNMASSVHSKTKVFCVHAEYDEMERFLQKQNRPTYQHIWAAKLFLQHILWNESRIGRPYWIDYWQRAMERLCRAAEKGYFTHAMMKNPELWMMQRLGKFQQQVMLASAWWKLVADARQVFLAGAGQVARGMLTMMSRHEIAVAGLIVTKISDNPLSIDGVPVYALDASPADSEHDLVIIAVTPQKSDVQQEIFAALVQAGYRNVIVLTKELQQALR